MNPDESEAGAAERERHSSTPLLPNINPGYDTPDSDYNYQVLEHQNKSSEDGKQQLIAVLTEPPIDTSTIYASSVVSDSDESVDKENQLSESVKKKRAASNYSESSKRSSKRTIKGGERKRRSAQSGSYAGSERSNSQKSYKECRKTGSLNDSQRSSKDANKNGKSNQDKRRGSIRFEEQAEGRNTPDDTRNTVLSQNRHGSINDKVIRSCTYAEGFRPYKNGSTSFPSVDQNERPSKSAKELGLTFDRDFSSPIIRSPRSSARYSAKSQVAESEDYYTIGSQYRLNLVDSASVTVRSSPDKADKHDTRSSAWGAPRMSPELYQDIKERLLKEGKFKDQLRKYWGLDIQDQLNKPDSDDDGYDTDLDTNLGNVWM